MLRNVDDWGGPHFTFHPDGAAPAAAGMVAVADAGPGRPTVTIDDAHFLFHADFKRAGPDLVLAGEDGRTVVIQDYFTAEQRATLLSREGMAIAPHVVEALAGPLAPGQYAQAAGAQPAAQAVGRVAKADGDAIVVRNGVAITVKVGDPILKGDVLQTRSGQLGVTFNDGSTINLTENARLVVNEFVYDPKGNANAQILDLVQGSLTFISGEVAHSGDMKIGTPVATMGIRGTVGVITGADTDQVSFSIVQSERGAVLIDNNSGREIAQVVQNGPLLVVRPVGPLQVLAEEVQKSPAELANELAALQHIVSVQSVGQQIIQQFFNPNQNNPQSNGTDHTQIQIEIPKSAILPDNPNGGGGNVNTAGTTATITVIAGNDGGSTNTPPLIDQFTVELPVNLPPIIFTPFASAFVSEEGLAKGIADSAGSADTTDAVVAQGTIDAGDGNGDQLSFTLGQPTVPLTSGGADIIWEGVGTNTLVGKADGETVITITIGANTGAYTVTLSGPVDHSNAALEDTRVFAVPVSVTDGQSTKTAALTVTIEDDKPVAVDYLHNVSTGVAVTKTVNLVVILDVSGSMYGENIALAKDALDKLLTTTNVQINQVMAVSFATEADVQGWTDAATANAFIQALQAGGSTHYDAALAAVSSNWLSGPGNADETLVYFISDGVPTSGHGADASSWESFLSGHEIDVSYAIGIGTGVDDPDLAPIAWTPADPQFSPIILDDASQLDATLQATVAETQNIFGDNASAGFGADGGRILSVTIDGITYTWDGASTIIPSAPPTSATINSTSVSVQTAAGVFDFHFADDGGHQAGDWSYSPSAQVMQPIEGIHYVLIDNDGDTSGGDIAFNLAPAINALNLDATDDCNSNDTTVTGIEILDADAGDTLLKLTAMVENGTLTFVGQPLGSLTGNGTNDLSALDTLANINAAFTSGFVYSPTLGDPENPNSLPANDKITLTVEDNHGASDSLTFVFNVPDQPEGDVNLTGTPGKDYIFATGQNNTLTGDGGSDTYVFGAGDIGGNDVITDFSLLDDFLLFEQSVFADADAVLLAAVDDGQGNTVVMDDANVMITLNGVDVSEFQNAGHGHILIV